MQLDHVFILCAVDAPEAAALSALGLKEGPPNSHPGQGTACRRFMFANAYLELLWVLDEREVRSEGAERTRLWERWSLRNDGACPFGIVLRPSVDPRVEGPPFPTWPYCPSYLPPGLAIDVAVDTPLNEPEFFYLGFQAERAQLTTDRALGLGAATITNVSIGTPVQQRSMAARPAELSGILSFHASGEHVLSLTFDAAIRQDGRSTSEFATRRALVMTSWPRALRGDPGRQT